MNTLTSQSQSKVFPRFFTMPVEMKAKSLDAGRPIFEDREYVEIHVAGNTKSVPVQKVTDEHKHRWPEQYAAFKTGAEQIADGTPLSEWQAMPASKAAELKALKIHTVEALAELSDTQMGRVGMGARDLVEKAKAFLAVSEDAKVAEKYAAENAQLRDDIAMMKAQIEELNKTIESQKKPAPKKKADK